MDFQLKTPLFCQTKKGSSYGEKGFSLIQLMTTLGILLIVASIAGFVYTGILDNARAATCKANLETLNTAVELYGQEYGAIPATLGDLKPKHLEKAYAQVMERRSWYTKFSVALLKISQSDKAYAEFLKYDNLRKFGAAEDSFHCPEDDNGGTSYGINGNLAGVLWAQVDKDVVVVGDSDSATFTRESDLRKRHGRGKVAMATTKGGIVVELGEDADSTDTGGVDPDFDTDASDADDTDDIATASSNAQAIIDAVLANNLYTPTRREALQNRMNNVMDDIAAGNYTGAIDKLQTFIDNVQTDIADGKIDEANGTDLMDMANGAIGMLGG
jgi:type II secretory pathway pseudopilin PulG